MINLYGPEVERQIREDKEIVNYDMDWYIDHILEWRDKSNFFLNRIGQTLI